MSLGIEMSEKDKLVAKNGDIGQGERLVDAKKGYATKK